MNNPPIRWFVFPEALKHHVLNRGFQSSFFPPLIAKGYLDESDRLPYVPQKGEIHINLWEIISQETKKKKDLRTKRKNERLNE